MLHAISKRYPCNFHLISAKYLEDIGNPEGGGGGAWGYFSWKSATFKKIWHFEILPRESVGNNKI